MKKLISLLACISLIATQALAEEGHNAAPEKKAEPAKAPPKDEHGGGQEKDAKEVNEKLVHVPVFKIPVIQNRRIKTYFLIEFMLEADSHEAALKLLKLRPKIIDALYADLYGVLAVVWYPGFHVNLDELKQRIGRICEKIAGQDLYENIYVQQFTVQYAAAAK